MSLRKNCSLLSKRGWLWILVPIDLLAMGLTGVKLDMDFPFFLFLVFFSFFFFLVFRDGFGCVCVI